MKTVMIIDKFDGTEITKLVGKIIDLELIQKDRQRVFDQVGALDNQITELKAKRARLLVETGMDGSAPDIGRINERLHNLRRCRSVFNAQREHFDFMLQYLRTKENRP